jgi:hypothetical protein
MTPSDTEQFLQQAFSLAKSGNKAEARKILADLIRKDSTNARVWYLYSQLVDETHQAIFCLEKVLELQPGDPQAIARLENLRKKEHLPDLNLTPIETPKPAQVSTPAPMRLSAPVVAAPNVSTPRPTYQAPVQNPAKKNNSCLVLIGGILITVFCLWMFSTFSSLVGGSSSPSPTKVYEPSKIDAFGMCIHFTKEQLKAPSTADFAAFSQSSVLQTGYEFTIRSWVDSQNSFGAMIRTDFICTVQYVGNDKWKLTKLDFLER